MLACVYLQIIAYKFIQISILYNLARRCIKIDEANCRIRRTLSFRFHGSLKNFSKLLAAETISNRNEMVVVMLLYSSRNNSQLQLASSTPSIPACTRPYRITKLKHFKGITYHYMICKKLFTNNNSNCNSLNRTPREFRKDLSYQRGCLNETVSPISRVICVLSVQQQKDLKSFLQQTYTKHNSVVDYIKTYNQFTNRGSTH